MGLRPGQLPRTVLLPGDPDRASQIAGTWESSELLRERREFRSYRGEYRGAAIGVLSSGIGGPSMEIAVQELRRLGVETLIRVGTCGTVRPAVRPGDLVISEAAARFDGIGELYAPLGFPAVAHPDVLRALVDAARDQGVRFHVGIGATVRTFYFDQGRTGPVPPWASGLRLERQELRALGLLHVEMETATLFVLARVLGMRAGAICTVLRRDARGDPVPEDPRPAIDVANEAVRRLAGVPQ